MMRTKSAIPIAFDDQGRGEPVLHLYAQPADPEFLQAQEKFAEANPWFTVRKLNAKSHIPMLEIPEEMANAIESFVAQR